MDFIKTPYGVIFFKKLPVYQQSEFSDRVSSDQLRSLYLDKNFDYTFQIYSHKNTPIDVLVGMALDGELLSLSNANVPSTILKIFVDNRDFETYEPITTNPNTTTETLTHIFNTTRSNLVKKLAIRHQNFNMEIIEEFIDEIVPSVFDTIAQKENLNNELINKLIDISISMKDIQKILVENPACSSYHLLRILNFGMLDNESKIKLINHKKVSSEILDMLSTEKNSSVRYAVASHKNTSSEILVKMIDDEDISVINRIISNDNFPTLEVQCLLDHENEAVRIYAEIELFCRNLK